MTTPMHLQLGSIVVGTNRVRVDEHSYLDLEKHDDSDNWSVVSMPEKK
jgi:hypothetical protein